MVAEMERKFIRERQQAGIEAAKAKGVYRGRKPSVPVAKVVESRTGAVAWAMRQRSVSRPRSSNRTCGFPASGFPTGFSPRHTAGRQDERGGAEARQAHRTPLHD